MSWELLEHFSFDSAGDGDRVRITPPESSPWTFWASAYPRSSFLSRPSPCCATLVSERGHCRSCNRQVEARGYLATLRNDRAHEARAQIAEWLDPEGLGPLESELIAAELVIMLLWLAANLKSEIYDGTPKRLRLDRLLAEARAGAYRA